MIRIYFDENISRYHAKAFNSLEKPGKQIKVLSTVDTLGFGTKDEDIIPYLAEQGAALITKDSDFKRVSLWLSLVKEHRIGVFFFHTPKSFNKWDEFLWLTKAWPNIRKEALERKPPYLLEFKTDGKLTPKNLN